LWGYLKDAVCSTKPATPKEHWQETEWFCTAVPAATLVVICHSVAHHCQLCHKANGGEQCGVLDTLLQVQSGRQGVQSLPVWNELGWQ